MDAFIQSDKYLKCAVVTKENYNDIIQNNHLYDMRTNNKAMVIASFEDVKELEEAFTESLEENIQNFIGANNERDE